MISQVLWNRRPPNDKLFMCGSVFTDVHWPTNDDIMYSVWKKTKKPEISSWLLMLLMRMFYCHIEHFGSHLRWVSSLCFHSDLHFFVDLCMDAFSILGCWIHKPWQVLSLLTWGSRWVHWSSERDQFLILNCNMYSIPVRKLPLCCSLWVKTFKLLQFGHTKASSDVTASVFH